MEVTELVSFYIDNTTSLLEVTFRTMEDNDDEVRQDTIDLTTLSDFNYDFLSSLKQINEEEEDDDLFYDDYSNIEDDVEYDEIVSFLNEYYLIYPKRLPKSELF